MSQPTFSRQELANLKGWKKVMNLLDLLHNQNHHNQNHISWDEGRQVVVIKEACGANTRLVTELRLDPQSLDVLERDRRPNTNWSDWEPILSGTFDWLFRIAAADYCDCDQKS